MEIFTSTETIVQWSLTKEGYLDWHTLTLLKSNIFFLKEAEGFNDFFVNVGPRLSSYITESNVTFKTYLNESINENITQETVSKLKPKNSSGKGNISTKLLEIIDCIDYPIAHLFNLSFKTGYIPSEYKCFINYFHL